VAAIGGWLLEIRELQYWRGRRKVLDIPNLGIATGEVVVLIGPNGAGKSTLLSLMAGLEKPTRGNLLYKGEQVWDSRNSLAYRRTVSLVLQEALMLKGSVTDNTALALMLRGIPKNQARAIAGTWLERMGVAHLAERSARHLSGGEAQRVNLARAMAVQPELLLLDEPFTSLDATGRLELKHLLERVITETGVTTCLSTHTAVEIPVQAERLVVVENGTIVADGPVQHLAAHPSTLFMEAFFNGCRCG